MKRCLDLSSDAQRELYDRYKDAMYTLLYRLIGNEEDAADALQEAFIQVFKGLKNFRYRSTLGAWIKTIVVRAGISQLNKSIPIHDHAYMTLNNTCTEDENLLGYYLEQAIHQLPKKCRAVFILVEVEGYAHHEVADIMDISIGTSKSQLSYAKKLLQKSLMELKYDL